MAELPWTGAANTAFNNVNNWIDESTGTVPGSAPANSDTLTVNQGSRDIAGAVTGLTGVTMSVGPEYNGTIAPGGTLDINLTALYHYGKKGNYGGTITYAEVDTRSKVNFNPSGAETITTLVTKNSPVDVLGNCVVTYGYFTDGEVNIAANGTAMTKCEVNGSAVVNTLRSGLFDVGPGATVRTEATATPTTGTVVQAGGTLLINAGVDFPSSCVCSVKGRGRFDCSGSRRTFDAETVQIGPGAFTNFFTGVGEVTVIKSFLGRPFGGPSAGPGIPV